MSTYGGRGDKVVHVHCVESDLILPILINMKIWQYLQYLTFWEGFKIPTIIIRRDFNRVCMDFCVVTRAKKNSKKFFWGAPN